MSLFSSNRSNRTSAGQPRKARLFLEILEDRALPSCNVISGFVYLDANANGLMDTDETPIANSPIQLRDSAGQVVGSTTTDANGFYEFEHDESVAQTETTLTKTVEFPSTETDFSLTRLVDQFDTELGELLEIEIIHDGAIASEIKVENTSPVSSSNIKGTVSGSLKLAGPGVTSTLTLSENAGTYSAGLYDGAKDYSGDSGHSFGVQTAEGNESITLTGADMDAYKGTGQVTFTSTGEASSFAQGGGNLDVSLNSSGKSKVTVIYKYTPGNCLQAGAYTIVQTTQPPGLLDGQESSGGVVVPNSAGTDTISVTLADADLTDNNFGETAGGLSGFVYVDSDDDGVKDASEGGISGVIVTLGGSDVNGQVNKSATTGIDGSYSFTGLLAGTYELIETQPENFNDGKDTIGSQGGTVANDHFSGITLAAGQNGTDNNFGEISPDIADLEIVKTASADVSDVGGQLTYSLTITNHGTHTAQQVLVSDTLPLDASFLSAAGDGWTITNTASTVTATLPSLEVGTSSQFQITIQVPGVANSMTNSATVTSQTPDDDSSNNQSTVTTGVVFNQAASIAPLAVAVGQLQYFGKKQLISGGSNYLNINLANPVLRNNMVFASGVFSTLTGRATTTQETNNMGQALTSGGLSKQQLISNLFDSDAHRTQQVSGVYQDLLDRAPTQQELTDGITQLRGGDSEIDLTIAVLTSEEYQTLHPTAGRLIGGFYMDIVGELPDLSVSQQLTQSNEPTSEIVQSLVFSDEGLANSVNDVFRATLRRSATADEITQWSAELEDGLTPGELTQQLLASDEFLQLALSKAA
ncbi:MAG: choice-of-anchor E domain-containing protein [Gemmataceae bacterium]|nr:choice-of-anchor E domain-containing protein [Gemmataceae bacterium]MCI0738813.1 choice-of-anchor E domain-containing protein [Gemmataceae bacterium]